MVTALVIHHTFTDWIGLALAVISGLVMLGWHWRGYFNGRYERWAARPKRSSGRWVPPP